MKRRMIKYLHKEKLNVTFPYTQMGDPLPSTPKDSSFIHWRKREVSDLGVLNAEGGGELQ